MATTKTSVHQRRKVAVKKVGAKKAAPKGVQTTNSHNNPTAPKSKGGPGKSAPVHVQNTVSVREYPGEGKNSKPFGSGVKIVGSGG